jgi:hypothetical protein
MKALRLLLRGLAAVLFVPFFVVVALRFFWVNMPLLGLSLLEFADEGKWGWPDWKSV